MNLSVFLLGWRGNLTVLTVGGSSPPFPDSMVGFCDLNMKLRHVTVGEGAPGTPMMSSVGGFHQHSHQHGHEKWQSEGSGLEMYFPWLARCLDVYCNAVDWFTFSVVHHTPHPSLS